MAVVLVRVSELAVHRERIAAAARAFLDACTDPVRRRWADEAFCELSPTYLAQLAALVPRGRFSTVPGVPHDFWSTHPEVWTQTITNACTAS